MPKRINPVAQYMVCLAMTIFAYTLYAQFAVPAIEGPPQLVKKRITTPTAKPSSQEERKIELAGLLPKNAWELEFSNALQTSHGKILFKDYQPEGDYLVVFPFTMIMDGKPVGEGETPSPPTVLRCLQEARIKFDRPFNVSGAATGGPNHMERAQLTGEVVIYRPPTSPEKNDAMQIVTRNVQIEKETVYTLEEVSFQFGPNKGKGRNLLIELAHAELANSAFTPDFSQIEGVQRIQLAFLNNLNLVPSSKKQVGQESSSLQEGTSPAPQPTGILSNNQSPIDITCQGPFDFDIAANTATLSKQVVVRQQDQFGDDLHCEQLVLVFEGDDQTALNPMKANNASMRIKRITATGNPAVINAHSRDTRISGDELVYDLSTNRVVGKSQLGSVTVANKEYQFDARSFVYSIPADQSLGPLHAQGPGRMVQIATQDREEFRASWKDKLVVTDDESGMKLIQLDGAAKISVNQNMRIDSDHLKFWLWPNPFVKIDPKTGRQTRQWDYQPVKLFTEGNVVIDSPRLAGATSQLTATWPKPVQTGSGAMINPRVNPQPLAVMRHFEQRPVYEEVGEPQPRTEMIAPVNRNAQVALASFEQPAERERKFRFRGNSVNVQLSSHESGSEIRQLEIEGNVDIEETRTAKPSDRPLKISGDRLQMLPQGAEVYRIQVAGSTQRRALVDAEGLKLTGVTIHMDQSANKLWVEGAGELKMNPTAKQPAGPIANATRPSQIDVSWGGGMVFDGRTIYFEQDVIMNAAQQPNPLTTRKTTSLSQGLSVRLTKPVNFKNLSQEDRPQAENGVEIEEIVLVDQLQSSQRIFQLAGHPTPRPTAATPIVVENQDFDATGKLIEKQKIIVPRATIDAISGDITATGPGTIMNHRKGKSSFSLTPKTPSAPVQSNSGISFLQIDFDKSLQANTKTEDMLISGNVRTLYAPVKDWNQTLDPDKTVRIPTGGVKLTCETVSVSQWQPRSATEPTNEVNAQGNAHIYGDLFEATADRVSYDDATDFLVIEGTPRTDAHLRYQQRPGAQPDDLVAGKIRYRISDQHTEVLKIKNGSFSPNGNLFDGKR